MAPRVNPPEEERNLPANLATCSESWRVPAAGGLAARVPVRPQPALPPATKGNRKYSSVLPLPAALQVARSITGAVRLDTRQPDIIQNLQESWFFPSSVRHTALAAAGLDHMPNALLETYLTAGWITFRGKL